jgi:hypothetical protein
MGLDAAVGNFALNTSTGNQSVATLSFTPKIVLFFATQNTADGVIVDQNICIGAGISSTERGNTSVNDEDAADPTDTSRTIFNTSCITMLSAGSSSSYLVVADLVSLNSDGFTIDITTAPGSAHRVGYLALGGTDITDVAIGTITVPASTGNDATTGVGFQPDSALFFANGEAINTDTNDNTLGFGFAVSTSQRGWSGIAAPRNQATSIAKRFQVTDACIGYMDHDAASIDVEADFVSWDADGFTLNYSAVHSGDAIIYVAFKGGQYAVGDVTTQTGTGTWAETGVGFEPSAGIFSSFQNAASGSIVDGAKTSVGFASSASDMFVAGGVIEDAQAAADSDQYQDDALVYASYDFTQTLTGSADLDSWDSDGFTLNMIDADPSAFEMLYWVIGAEAAAGFSVNTTQAITVAESVTVTIGDPQIDASQATTVSESVTVARQEATARSVSTAQAVEVAEAVSIAIGDPQIDTTQNIDVSEAVQGAVSSAQIDTSQASTVAESVTVSVIAVGALAVAVQDDITVAESITVSIETAIDATQAITVAESIAATIADDLVIATTQAVTVSESVGVAVLAEGVLTISVSESVTVAESTSIAVTIASISISVADNIAVTESVSITSATLQIDTAQAITVSESVVQDVPRTVSVTENVVISETVTVDPLAVALSVVDSITVSESVVLVVPIDMSIADNITASETVTVAPLAVVLSVADAITIAESITAATAALQIDAAQAITVSESATVEAPRAISVLDSVTASETVTIDPIGVLLSVIQAIVITEATDLRGLDRIDITLSESQPYEVTMAESQPFDVTLGDAAIVDVSMTDVTRN